MSDEFRPGDWAVRVEDGPDMPGLSAVPIPLDVPVLVVNVRFYPFMTDDGPVMVCGLVIAGHAIYPSGAWNSDYFLKVPPPESIEEPRRVATPAEPELEPA